MSDKQDYNEIARYCQSDDSCLTQCQSGNFMAGHLYTCALEVEQLRADKRELVEGLKWYEERARAIKTYLENGKYQALEAVMKELELDEGRKARDLITKHGES